MKFTQIPSTTFQELQLNAGVMLTDFDPTAPAVADADIFAATNGGVTFNSGPQFEDYGDGIDNVPPNTKQLKVVKSWEAHLTGTARTVNADTVEALMAACAATTTSGRTKYEPYQGMVAAAAFADIWWVGDYSDKNGATKGGFIAVHLIDALNTGGFQIKSNDDDKGDFAFDFLAHYDLTDPDTVPFEVYLQPGAAESNG